MIRFVARSGVSLLKEAQQAAGFGEQEMEVGEGFEADVLPAHVALAIHQENPVEGGALEVVVSMPFLEGRQRRVGRQRE